MAFSYTVLGIQQLPPSIYARGKQFRMWGSFTDAQSGGSAMDFATDYGMTECEHFRGTNLTDTDEVVQVAISGAEVTITTVSNDDDGTWDGVFIQY